MRTQIKLLGWLYIIFGVLGGMAAICVATIIAGGGMISGDQTAILATGIVATVLCGILLLTAIPGIIVGAGLLGFKSWARVLAIILGVFNLLNFPIGTILGIYTLYITLDDESSEIFAG